MVAKVMIVEDSSAQILNYQRILSEDKEIEIVDCLKDGESAVEVYSKIKPDIVLLDLGIPKKNGLQVINEVSEIDTNCNIIVISGDVTLRYNLLNTRKIFKIIPKPARSETIFEAVNDLKNEIKNSNFPIELAREILLSFKLNPYSQNSVLLMQILRFGYSNINDLENMNNLYNKLSYINNCNSKKIESRIRSIVNSIKRPDNIGSFQKYFYLFNENDYNYITPKVFVSGIVLYMQKETRI